jgi:hypothetical protein
LSSSYYDCSSGNITSFLSGLLETPHSCHGTDILWTIQTNTLESVLYEHRRALTWVSMLHLNELAIDPSSLELV